MLKFFYKKTIALILSNILISATAVSSAQAYMRPLSPYNFNEMYKMAARGDVASLHKAISRGLNINAMDANGDTGVCVAVKRRDAKAYNTFRAAGASGSPHCRWNISHWDSFIDSAPVRAGAKWRSADYTMPVYAGAAEKSNMWWWIGGAAALGGGAALALGGGGGGGGSDNKPKPAICDTTEYPISGNCPDNGVCGQCVDSVGAHYKLNSCNDGYTLSNDKKSCIQNQNPTTCDTTEYPISGSCPDNGVCGQCVDSAGAHYKLNSCNDGYTLSNDKKSCIQNQNPTICDTTEYPISGNCPDNGVCGQCVDSTGAHYKLNSCNVGYIMATDKKSCFKFEPDPCDTTVYTMTSCPENGICGDCTDSNGKYYKFNGCQSGYFVGADGQSCVETPEQVICNTAVYNLTGCPEGALCSPCTDTTGTYYKFTGCLGGYTQKPNEETCVKVTESSDSDVANDKILVIDENNKVSDGDTKIIGFSNADSPNSNLFNAKTKDALITIDAVNNTTFKNHDLVGLGPINAGSVQTVNAYDGKTGDIVIKTYYGTHSIYGIYGSGTLYNSLNGVGNIEINSQGEQLNSGTQISGMHSYDSDKYLYNAFGGTGKITIKVAAGYINGMKGVNLINAYNGGNGEINITSKARDVVRDGYIRGMAFSSNNGGLVANAYANDDSVTTGTITINNTDSREAKGISGGKSLIDWDLSYRNMLIYNAYGKNSIGKIIINGPGAGIAVGYTDNQVYNGANGGYGYIEISSDSGAYYSGYVGGIFLYNSSNYGYNGSSGGTGEIKISFPNTIYDQEDDKKIIYGIYGAIDNGSPDGGKGIIDINVADNEAIGVYGGGNYKDSSIKVVSKTNSGTVKGISNVRHVQSGNTTEIKESFASSYVNHNNGTVTVEAKGANATGYGIYSKGVDAVNDVLGKISVSSTDSGNAYGIRTEAGKVINNGTINVSSESGSAYGIWARGGSVENNGSITVNAPTGRAYGICALGGATVINRGEIILNNTPCEGVCDGSVANGNYIKFDDYSTLSNASLISAAGALDFDAMGGRVMLAEGGRFAADELSGRLSVAADITAKGFKNEYTAADAIASADVSRLNLQSQSALFDAKLAENGRDVTLTMKSFNEVVKNKSLANFLQNNYAAQNNENLFSSLKSLENVEQINNGLNKFAGQDLFSRMAFEDFTMLRELNFDMNEQMFGGNKNEYFSISGNTAPFAFENNNGSNSRWSLTGKKSGDTTYALGFAFTDVYSNGADNQNRRADRMFNISAPVGYKLGGLKMVSTPRFGYAYGTYNRKGFNNRDYKGTLSKQMFGFMNEARLPFKAAGWTLAPSAELNMVNYRTEGAEADNLPYALRVKEQNNYSLETGLGLHAGKQVNFDEQSALSFNLSAAVYHEFGNPYETKVTVNGMSGNFAVKDENRGANRAVLRSNFEFTRGNTVLGGALMSYFDRSLNSKASLNLKYGF